MVSVIAITVIKTVLRGCDFKQKLILILCAITQAEKQYAMVMDVHMHTLAHSHTCVSHAYTCMLQYGYNTICQYI